MRIKTSVFLPALVMCTVFNVCGTQCHFISVAQKPSINPPEGLRCAPATLCYSPRSDINPPKSYGNRCNRLIRQIFIDGESCT